MHISKRRTLAEVYDKNLKTLENNKLIKLPPKFSTSSNQISTYQNYEIQAERRDELMSYLKKNNIGTIRQWGGFSIAHFEKLGFSLEGYSLTKSLFEKLLLLPMNHMLNKDEVQYICDSILEFYNK